MQIQQGSRGHDRHKGTPQFRVAVVAFLGTAAKRELGSTKTTYFGITTANSMGLLELAGSPQQQQRAVAKMGFRNRAIVASITGIEEGESLLGWPHRFRLLGAVGTSLLELLNIIII